ncbi:MAG: ATP-binding cassette domain-containing protein [Rhizobiales bacterium]|nr:ATP-binding cassette domain-containing protein [Hyphomicrobiales bacterium]
MQGVPLYRLRGLTFRAGGRAIVHPIDLDVPPRQVLALVGPNGSGKSTLLKMMARQLRPSGGAVELLGRPVTTMSDREFARQVAYMPQFTPPAEGMTVRELVGLGRFPWHGALGRFGPDDAAKVEAALVQTDLTEMAGRMVDSLSGGERQRAWLAMMVAQDARCLLLDEPTSALDIAHQVEMLKLVRKLAGGSGVGVVIVIHDINMAARFSDRIVALRRGEVAARGAPADILDAAVLKRIYGLEMGILPTAGLPVSYVP